MLLILIPSCFLSLPVLSLTDLAVLLIAEREMFCFSSTIPCWLINRALNYTRENNFVCHSSGQLPPLSCAFWNLASPVTESIACRLYSRSHDSNGYMLVTLCAVDLPGCPGSVRIEQTPEHCRYTWHDIYVIHAMNLLFIDSFAITHWLAVNRIDKKYETV